MKKLFAVLISLTLLCSCGAGETAETDTTVSVTETVAPMTEAEFTQTERTEQTAENLSQVTEEETSAVQTEAEYGYYEYQPPHEVLDAHFYSDDIETEIQLKSALSEDFSKDFELLDIFNDPKIEKKLYNAFAENLPQEIIDDMTLNIQFPDWLNEMDMELKITSMGYMKYDFNSDGSEDYYVGAILNDKSEVENSLYIQTFYSFDRIYISEDSGFMPITIPSFDDTRNSVNSILSTETNGLKDLLAFCNSNAPSLKYDGVSAYGGFDELDERHTFMQLEILPDNIVHFNMNISVIDASLGEYYTAIKFADNPYIKNNLLYTCYPNGTPCTYTKKPYGKHNDFSPAIEGYDFYAELTDEGVTAFTDEDNIWYLIDLLEIKYIAAE